MLDELIKAIHSRLTGNAGLTAVVPAGQIGNHVKDDASFPSIDWRLENVVDGDIKGEQSYQGDIVMDVFSDYNGDLQCYQIHGLIRSALSTVLTVTGANMFQLRFRSISISTDSDNRTRQATINYGFMIGET
jgi:hypothetical protein